MSKGVSEKASLELTFLAALDSIHADVDTSEIAEIQDWTGAVRGKFYGASIKEPSHLSRLKAGLLSALSRPIAANASLPSSGGALGASGSMASHGSVQYSQMAIPQLIAVCTSEASEAAWREFIRRSQPLIATVIAKAVRRFGNASHTLVDDLSQDVYLKLCKDNFRALKIVEILHENAFLGFLKAVATHTAQDYFRSAAAFKAGAAHELEAPEADLVFMEHGSSRDASPELEREILLKEIDTILKTLEHEPNFERDHAIFWLYYSQGLTAREIAALPDVKLSVKGVESTLLRLTRQIRVALTQKGEKGS
ncbi:MAG TPA: sigma-70 family RNA polymerase sigma factor [Candidatus Polarisedimenticolia bacterium]|nr:sigma-70 family RNA polymerase sigma factor [Candidatus Polarisedimenticolia bacterium]